jgi:hypothetical protein
MGKGSRDKGHAAENEIKEIINTTLNIDISRNLTQARDGGCDLSLPPYHIEVKRQERVSIDQWCHQAEESCKKAIPVVAYRRSREPWRVVLQLTDFLTLLKTPCPSCGGKNTTKKETLVTCLDCHAIADDV